MSKGTWGGTLGKFGLYCKDHEIDRDEMAKAIGVTASYISMFAHAKVVPGRKCAINIEVWTGIKFGDAFRVIDWPRDRLYCEKKAA